MHLIVTDSCTPGAAPQSCYCGFLQRVCMSLPIRIMQAKERAGRNKRVCDNMLSRACVSREIQQHSCGLQGSWQSCDISISISVQVCMLRLCDGKHHPLEIMEGVWWLIARLILHSQVMRLQGLIESSASLILTWLCKVPLYCHHAPL